MGLRVLGGLTPATFLSNYWQKKPLLIRGAFPGFVSPIALQDLLALACQDDVFPRLILEDAGECPWELLTGPFEADELQGLPETGWTILVGDVDRHVAAVADVLAPFRFLPNWRIDDVQASFAPPGGNAGPHVDNYDVFLVQGYGRRRWQISHTPAPDDVAFVPEVDVAILEEFVPDAEWILSPGDLLYLPPRIPHWGVAVDPCMTFSVGFRAPTEQDILHGLLDAAAASVDGTARFGDPGRAPTDDPGRIDAADLAWVRKTARRFLAAGEDLDRWFGAYITQPADALALPQEPLSTADVQSLLESGHGLRRLSVGYFAHLEGTGCLHLFACGQQYAFEGELVDAVLLLTGTQPLTLDTLKPYLAVPAFACVLTELINSGCLVVE